MKYKRKVLMVCTGNICRSPMAEGIYRHLASLNKLNHYVDSAATHAYHIGLPPDERAVAVMKKNGINISQLRARKVTSTDFTDFDLILVASDAHLKELQELAKDVPCTATIEKVLQDNQDLPDPYYGQASDFENTYNVLFTALNARLHHERIC